MGEVEEGVVAVVDWPVTNVSNASLLSLGTVNHLGQ